MRAIQPLASQTVAAADTGGASGKGPASTADGNAFAALLANGLQAAPIAMANSNPAAGQALPAAAIDNAVSAQTTLADQQRQEQQAAARDAGQAQRAQARAQADAERAAQQATQNASLAQAQANASLQGLQAQRDVLASAAANQSANRQNTASTALPTLAANTGLAASGAASLAPGTAQDGNAAGTTANANVSAAGTSPTGSNQESSSAETRSSEMRDGQQNQTQHGGAQSASMSGHPTAGAAVAHADSGGGNDAGAAGGAGSGTTFGQPLANDGSAITSGGKGSTDGGQTGLAAGAADSAGPAAVSANLQNLANALQTKLNASGAGNNAAGGTGLAGAAMLDGPLAGMAGFTPGSAAGGLGGPAAGTLAPALAGRTDSTGSARGELAPDSRLAFNPLAQDALQQSAASNPAAVGPTLPVAPAVGDTRWAAALGQQALFMATQQLSSAQLSINPPHLGPVRITLDVQQGQATASFVTSHEAVRHAIESSLPQLRDMFAAAGMDLTQAQVQADTGGNLARQSQQQAPQDWQTAGGSTDAIAAAGSLQAATVSALPQASTRTAAQRGLLDTFA